MTSRTTAPGDEVRKIIEGRFHDPFSILGPHRVNVDGEARVSVRAFIPGAEGVDLILGSRPDGPAQPMECVDAAGFFECVLPTAEPPRYLLRPRYPGGHDWISDDPYRFPPVLGELDLHLFAEGTHLRSFEKLGAHVMTLEGADGVHFSVWAPNAERVSIVGEFNGWDGRRSPMRLMGSAGVWEIFVPGLKDGDLYKYEIRSRSGELRLKSDPYGYRFEYRPGTSSIVHDIGKFAWQDQAWMRERRERDWLAEPISVFEVHLGSWRRNPDKGGRFLTYRELAQELGDYAVDMGYTHVELLPIQEHPFDGSWGYQPVGYFAPTSRFGTPDDFMYFVDHLHRRGLGVILDWVPAHFPRDDHGLRQFDGTCLFEHADPRQAEHRDWGTLIFNYGRNEVRNFLLASALFWFEKYHLDGLRVDAVASMIYLDYSRKPGEWIPNEHGGNENLEAVSFLKNLNETCHREHPGILTIAEESTAWTGVSRPTYLGGLGFSMKWNMGWMNDTLYYLERDPVHRKYHHQSLTFSLIYAFTENFILPLSHDEVVHGKRSLLDKMPGDPWQRFANLRLLHAFQFTHPGKKLGFMGGEFAHGREWDHDASLDWHLLDLEAHRGVQNLVRDLNRLYRSELALYQLDFDWRGFEWIDFHDWESSVVAFLRKAEDAAEFLLVIVNFTPVARSGYRVGVPEPGSYRELLNSDASCYGGSGAGNLGRVEAAPIPSHGHSCSLELTVPPLAAVVFKRG